MEQLMSKEVLQVMNEVYQRKPQFFIDNFSFFRETLESREDSGFKRGLQQTLIRQLHRRFKDVPASVVQREYPR